VKESHEFEMVVSTFIYIVSYFNRLRDPSRRSLAWARAGLAPPRRGLAWAREGSVPANEREFQSI